MHDDTTLIRSAIDGLNRNPLIPCGIRVSVLNAWVTLHGRTEWPYVRAEALRTIRAIEGVLGVSNLIRVDLRPGPGWGARFKHFWNRLFPSHRRLRGHRGQRLTA